MRELELYRIALTSLNLSNQTDGNPSHTETELVNIQSEWMCQMNAYHLERSKLPYHVSLR